jgi:hypothetical protein
MNITHVKGQSKRSMNQFSCTSDVGVGDLTAVPNGHIAVLGAVDFDPSLP